MRLPYEIFLIIARAATDTCACDTSLGCTTLSARSTLMFQLYEAKKTKLALCLVSRAARELCISFLYEVVTVYDPRRLEGAISALHRYGHLCRRLDVDIISDSYAWPHVAAELWALLCACSHLDVLNISILPYTGGVANPPGRFNFPLSFIIHIADSYGTRLRRLELGGGITVYYRALGYLSSRCSALEVLVVPGLFAAPSELLGDAVEDDAIPEDVWRLPPNFISAADTSVTRDYRAAITAAEQKAQTFRTRALAYVSLRRLHTLEIGDYVFLMRHWDLPALKMLHLSYRNMHGMLLDGDDQLEALSQRGHLLKGWTYHGVDLDPLPHLNLVPNIEYLAINPEDMEHPECPDYEILHSNLQVIDLCPRIVRFVWPWVKFILDMARSDRLPNLRTCRVLDWSDPIEAEKEFIALQIAFKAVGVELEAGVGQLVNNRHVLHVPSLLSVPAHYWSAHSTADYNVRCFAKKWPEIVLGMSTYQQQRARLETPRRPALVT